MKGIFKIIETESHQAVAQKINTTCMCGECDIDDNSYLILVTFGCRGIRENEVVMSSFPIFFESDFEERQIL